MKNLDNYGTKPTSESQAGGGGNPTSSPDKAGNSQLNLFRIDTDAGQRTAEGSRAGYGCEPKAEGHPSGGHNIDAHNQYTVKMPRGSSL
jgi:hypothetical protein